MNDKQVVQMKHLVAYVEHHDELEMKHVVIEGLHSSVMIKRKEEIKRDNQISTNATFKSRNNQQLIRKQP